MLTTLHITWLAITEKELSEIGGEFQAGIGPPGPDAAAIAEIPTKFALTGMKKNGPFSQLIAHGIIVLEYELWNEDYRSKIAEELGWNTNDVMCDLRLIRHWITHNGSKADNKLENLKVLHWPKETGPFAATQVEMDEIQLAINTMCIYQRKSMGRPA